MPWASARSCSIAAWTSSRSSASSVRVRLRVGGEELFCEPEVDAQRDEVLLRAVVEVALDPQPLGICRGDDPCARGTQLLGLPAELVERPLQRRVEANVAQGEAHLPGDLGEDSRFLVVELLRRRRAARPRSGRAARLRS